MWARKIAIKIVKLMTQDRKAEVDLTLSLGPNKISWNRLTSLRNLRTCKMNEWTVKDVGGLFSKIFDALDNLESSDFHGYLLKIMHLFNLPH